MKLSVIKCNIQYIVHGLQGLLKYLFQIDQTTETMIIYRRRICRGCTQNTRRFLFFRICKLCGCWLRAKTSIGTEGCPIHLWYADENPDSAEQI